jgi:hypothetical protein
MRVLLFIYDNKKYMNYHYNNVLDDHPDDQTSYTTPFSLFNVSDVSRQNDPPTHPLPLRRCFPELSE